MSPPQLVKWLERRTELQVEQQTWSEELGEELRLLALSAQGEATAQVREVAEVAGIVLVEDTVREVEIALVQAAEQAEEWFLVGSTWCKK